MQCIACTSLGKCWVQDGDFKKPCCTLHAIRYRREGYKVEPMTQEERKTASHERPAWRM